MLNKDGKINILVISISPWSETNAFGNTLSNFFAGWISGNLYNLYCREELPDNQICSYYFNINEKQLIKYMLQTNKIGRTYSSSDLEEERQLKTNSKDIYREKKLVDFFRKNRATVFLLAREMLWAIGGWKNENLDRFLHENKIDIIFSLGAEPLYRNSLIRYCYKKTKAKVVLFFADDTFCYKSKNPFKYIYQLLIRKSLKDLVEISSKLYGASQGLCNEYEQYFSKEIVPLYKGCYFENNKRKLSTSSPIKIVYAGNLFYGRWKILKILADEIEEINKDSIKIIMEVFTTATITDEINVALNRGQSSRIKGALPYEDVKRVLKEADIVLHVESFEPKQIKSTRLSFSTKIIDCMQSGSCLMAIGPQNIASIDYLKNIEGPIVVTEISRIGETLSNLIKKPENILSKANSLQKYAMKQHDINIVHERIQRDFSDLLKDNTFQ
jgi:hypothetical protein